MHDLQNDNPLAPKHFVIDKCKKLTPNLQDKTNYTVYIDNLNYYLKKGMKLKKNVLLSLNEAI